MRDSQGLGQAADHLPPGEPFGQQPVACSTASSVRSGGSAGAPGALEDDGDLTPRRMLRIIIRELLQRAAPELLVQLGQLPRRPRPAGPAPATAARSSQQGGQPGRRLEEHDAPLLRGRTGKEPGPLAALAGNEAEEEVPVAPGRPAADSAVATAEGPGIGTTVMPAARAAATRSAPGSLTAGVPASDTRATSRPSCRISSSVSSGCSSECAW